QDARQFLEDLVGRELRAISGRANRVLTIEGEHVVVATERSPNGKPVPIAWVQSAMDQLAAGGGLTIDVESVGDRSAFIGAILSELPGTRVYHSSPPRIELGR